MRPGRGILLALPAALLLLAPVGLPAVATDSTSTGTASAARRSQPPPAGDAKAGAAVFGKAGCGGCHVLAAAGAKGSAGPNLDRSKPPYDRVVTLVTNGRGAMPSFKSSLSSKEIADVATYIAESVGAAKPRPGGQAKPPAAVVRVVLGEWLLIASPRILPAGRIALVVRNKGDRPHALVVRRADPAPRLLGGVPLLRPGRTARLTLSLRPGVYVLYSDRLPDLRKGMLATLSVRAAKGVPSAPPGSVPGTAGGAGQGGAAPGGSGSAGAQVFAQAGCGSCHTLAAAGASGTLGPNLDQLKLSAAQVAGVVRSGRGTMPSYAGQLTDAQISDLAAYIAGAAGGGGAPGGPISRPQDGRGLFQIFCGACHRLQAAGTSGTAGPNLDREHSSAKEVVEVVTSGDEGMPSFSTTLSAREIRILAEWVATATGGGRRHDDDDD